MTRCDRELLVQPLIGVSTQPLEPRTSDRVLMLVLSSSPRVAQLYGKLYAEAKETRRQSETAAARAEREHSAEKGAASGAQAAAAPQPPYTSATRRQSLTAASAEGTTASLEDFLKQCALCVDEPTGLGSGLGGVLGRTASRRASVADSNTSLTPRMTPRSGLGGGLGGGLSSVLKRRGPSDADSNASSASATCFGGLSSALSRRLSSSSKCGSACSNTSCCPKESSRRSCALPAAEANVPDKPWHLQAYDMVASVEASAFPASFEFVQEVRCPLAAAA
jgi:hypothetical protein